MPSGTVQRLDAATLRARHGQELQKLAKADRSLIRDQLVARGRAAETLSGKKWTALRAHLLEELQREGADARVDSRRAAAGGGEAGGGEVGGGEAAGALGGDVVRRLAAVPPPRGVAAAAAPGEPPPRRGAERVEPRRAPEGAGVALKPAAAAAAASAQLHVHAGRAPAK